MRASPNGQPASSPPFISIGERGIRPHHQLRKANEAVDPHFVKALRIGYGLELKVFAFNCEVTGKEITLNERIPVIL
jgi:DNA-binding sugar fermentation-stimulating protein